MGGVEFYHTKLLANTSSQRPDSVSLSDVTNGRCESEQTMMGGWWKNLRNSVKLLKDGISTEKPRTRPPTPCLVSTVARDAWRGWAVGVACGELRVGWRDTVGGVEFYHTKLLANTSSQSPHRVIPMNRSVVAEGGRGGDGGKT